MNFDPDVTVRTADSQCSSHNGGQNPAGHCVCDGGLVIDLSQMRTVEVDVGMRIARADGGTTWLDFDSATQASALVTPGGVVVATGVAGLTLGGGIGHPTAQYGLYMRRPRRSRGRHSGRGRDSRTSG